MNDMDNITFDKRLARSDKSKPVAQRLLLNKVFVCMFTVITIVLPTIGDVIHITEGSSSGYEMVDGNTYVIDNSVSFTNSMAGGSGITIASNATVVVFIPSNVTLTAIGAAGSGRIGGGAGIRVPETSTLVLTGEGMVDAVGGNAGDGEDGLDGGDGGSITTSSTFYTDDHSVFYSYSGRGISGVGGNGGAGGGGAGAGIGGDGGTGGMGGFGGKARNGNGPAVPNSYAGKSYSFSGEGEVGGNGLPGDSSSALGTLYVLGSLRVFADGGENGSNGVAGVIGTRSYNKSKSSTTSSSWYYFVTSGGGGGGGGGAGSAPVSGIGGGGAAGGGGGGGGSGATAGSMNKDLTGNANGGGGLGGVSAYSNGMTGVAKGTTISGGGTPGYTYYSGGNGGEGGGAGRSGGEGMFYASPLAEINVERSPLSTETHSAAQYAITFDADGGINSSVTNEVIATLGCRLPNCISEPIREGYKFCGWRDGNGALYYDGSGDRVVSCYSIPSNISLRAEWSVGRIGMNISPADGTIISGSQQVVISCEKSDAKIYYTLDGSEPSHLSTAYRKFRVSGKTTVRAIAILEYDGWTNSEVAVAHYALGQCPDPVIVSADGETFVHIGNWISIDWECEDGVLRYTTDGSDVTEASPVYAGPFTIGETTIIKAKAFGLTYFDSKQVELTVTREWEAVATPVIVAEESFSGSKTIVSISCATEGASIRYTTDGSEPNSHSMRYGGAFEVRETTVVKVFAMLADYADSEVVTKTITKIWGIGDSVGLPDHAFATDGDAEWVDDGGAAMRSGKITHKQTSVLRSTFVGKGRLTFELKTSCEEDLPEYMEYDRVEVWMNDALKMKQDGVHDWNLFQFDLDADSTTVEWRYVKDEMDDAKYPGEDCVWVRNIVWLPEYTCTTEVPVALDWIREKYGDLGNYYYDYEEKANSDAANGRKVWQCYVTGECPTDAEAAFCALIELRDDKVYISWKPNLNTDAVKRIYRIVGRTDLDRCDWESPVQPWHRFFKVEVSMPTGVGGEESAVSGEGFVPEELGGVQL